MKWITLNELPDTRSDRHGNEIVEINYDYFVNAETAETLRLARACKIGSGTEVFMASPSPDLNFFVRESIDEILSKAEENTNILVAQSSLKLKIHRGGHTLVNFERAIAMKSITGPYQPGTIIFTVPRALPHHDDRAAVNKICVAESIDAIRERLKNPYDDVRSFPRGAVASPLAESKY